MGILDRLGLGTRPDYLAGPNAQTGISGLFSDQSSLNSASIVWSDLLDPELIEALPLSRAEAISIPAVSKARNLLVSTIAKWPLKAFAAGTEEAPSTETTTAHPWLYRTNTGVTPYERMVWTVDDAIMYGCSLWIRENGPETDGRTPIRYAAYCPFEWWYVDNQGRIIVKSDGRGPGEPVSADDVIFFNFPFEGLLNIATRTLRGARDLERAWVGRSKNPIPMVNLARNEDYGQSPEEAAEMVQAWATARTNPNGAIGSTPFGVTLEVHGDVPVELMIEGRNAVRTDIGSFLNVRTAMLDGTIGVDSLTYSTKEGERNSFFEIDVPFWTDPIEQRLSLDDIVPRGQRVRFEKYQSAPADTGPEVED